MLVNLNGVLDRIESRLDKIESKLDVLQKDIADMRAQYSRIDERLHLGSETMQRHDRDIKALQALASKAQAHCASERAIDRESDKTRDRLRTIFMLLTALAATGSLVITLLK
jgi:chromosome segregation ATPase